VGPKGFRACSHTQAANSRQGPRNARQLEVTFSEDARHQTLKARTVRIFNANASKVPLRHDGRVDECNAAKRYKQTAVQHARGNSYSSASPLKTSQYQQPAATPCDLQVHPLRLLCCQHDVSEAPYPLVPLQPHTATQVNQLLLLPQPVRAVAGLRLATGRSGGEDDTQHRTALKQTTQLHYPSQHAGLRHA
jgi:hypothetical protein